MKLEDRKDDLKIRQNNIQALIENFEKEIISTNNQNEINKYNNKIKTKKDNLKKIKKEIKELENKINDLKKRKMTRKTSNLK